jgi:hypothetical protein
MRCCLLLVTLPLLPPLQVIDAINALSRGKEDKTATVADGAVITDAGQIRKGSYIPNLEQM